MKFYRYRSLNQFASDIIVKKELYFAGPKEFNDPFEFEFLVDFEASIKEKREFLESSKDFDFKGAFQMGSEDIVAEFLSHNYGPTNSEKLRQDFRQRMLEKSGILCLADCPTNIGLWAHYGDNHKGICFEFDFVHENFGDCFKVEYSLDVPRFKYFEDFEGRKEYIVRKIISSKSICWEYEHEYRFVLSKPGFVKFHPNSLKAAYIGMNVDKKIMKFSKRWLLTFLNCLCIFSDRPRLNMSSK